MNLTKASTFVLALALATAIAAPASSATPKQAYNALTSTSKNTSKSTSKRSRVSLKAARATALAEVPGGVVKSQELEREGGRLLYTFDIQEPGKTGIEEVHIDARTGKLIGKQHETAAKEKHEAAQEKKEPAKSTTKTP